MVTRIILRDTILIFKKEIICFLRDRNIIIYSIIFPIFLYPMTFWIINEISLFQRGTTDKKISRIMIVNPSEAPEFTAFLKERNKIRIVKGNANKPLENCDAAIEFADSYLGKGGPCYRLKIYYDSSKDYSKLAETRLVEALDKYRLIVFHYFEVDNDLVSDSLQSFKVKAINIASSKGMGIFIIGQLLPMMIIIMSAMGTFYPAIDVIVGERERKTLETTLLSPTFRFSIVAGKFLAVVLAGIVAALLNIVSLGITASHTIFLLEKGKGAAFSIPINAVPLLFISTALISACFGAACILIASYARTFREGQSLVSPFFIISFQPAVISALPGIKLTSIMALIPVANVSLMFKEIINGEYHWKMIIIVLISLTFYTAIILIFAARRIKNENTLWGERKVFSEKKGGWWKLFGKRGKSDD